MKGSKWMALTLAAILAVGVLGIAGCAPAAEETNGTAEEGSELTGSITVEGSDTLVNVAQAWAEAYQEAEPGVMISVKGGGSGNGIAALINGTVDFANASRNIKDEEIEEAQANSVEPVEHTVALDGIVVIVNPGNGVEDISLEDLGKIYRGEITNWSDIGGADAEIVLLGRDTSSGTYEYFKEEVVEQVDGGEYAASMRNLPSNQAQVDEVKGNAAAIGYVGIGYAESAGSDVKLLKVDGVAPSIDTVVDASYPLSRGLYMYSNGAPEGLLKAYLDWIMGADGQAIVEDQGFVKVQ